MIGEILGSYRLVRQIGAGGMGTVYFAQHQLIGRRAAVKVLLPQYSRDANMVNRFFNEARTTTLIQHPGLVDIFDFGFHPSGAAYLVMEYLDGESLGARRKREGRLPVWLVDAIVRQMASALGAAHRRGIVHRDLKPDNIFLVPDRSALAMLRVKVLDFGVAKLDAELGGSNTSTGSMLGTPQYMSPEQCRGAGGVDYRSDIYAVGCIMFELLTGRPVFAAQGLGVLLAAHQRLPPPRLAAIDSKLPPELDVIMQRLLAKRPEDRLQSLEELEAALESLALAYGWEAFWGRRSSSVPVIPVSARGTPIPPVLGTGANPPTTMSSTAAGVQAPPRARRSWLLATLVFAGVGAGAGYFALRGQAGPSPVATPQPVARAAVAAGPDAAALAVAAGSDAAVAALVAVAPPPDAAPAKVTLRIDSDPPNAEVYRGDERLGTTPFRLDEPRRDGEVTLVVRLAGHDDATVHLAADRDGQTEVKLLERRPAAAPPGRRVRPKPVPPAPAPPPKKHKIEL